MYVYIHYIRVVCVQLAEANGSTCIIAYISVHFLYISQSTVLLPSYCSIVGVPLLYDAVFTHVHACVHVAIPFIFMYRRRFEEGREVYVCVADSLPPDLTDLAFRLHL